jgi:basic amino acid/polyamine antiporter, APA family
MAQEPTTGKQALGFWALIALVVGNQIGSGIYLLPATLAPLGGNATIGWIVTIAGALCLALVFARLGTRLPLTGGPYAFARAAFGPQVGFAVAWSYWAFTWAGNAAVAVAVVSALSAIVPAFDTTPGAAPALAIGLVWLVIAINVRGVALAGRVQMATTILKLVPLVMVIGVAGWLLLRHGSAAVAPDPPVALGAGTIAGAAAMTFWGFLGVESATIPADKVRDARRIVAPATLFGTALTGLVYLLVSTAVAMLMPRAEAAGSTAPIATFLARSLGSGFGELVALFAAISALGALNGFTLVQGEMPWAMARGGVFPAWFGAETPQGTPARAQFVSGVLITLLTLLNYSGKGTADLFSAIATITLAVGMLAYLVSALAAIRLLPRDPVAVAAGLASAGFVLWMVYGLGWWPDAWGLALLAAGIPFYLWARAGRVTPAAAPA